MRTVEIGEVTTYHPYCTACRQWLGGDAWSTRPEAERAAARHEVEQHPDPDEEDA